MNGVEIKIIYIIHFSGSKTMEEINICLEKKCEERGSDYLGPFAGRGTDE